MMYRGLRTRQNKVLTRKKPAELHHALTREKMIRQAPKSAASLLFSM